MSSSPAQPEPTSTVRKPLPLRIAAFVRDKLSTHSKFAPDLQTDTDCARGEELHSRFEMLPGVLRLQYGDEEDFYGGLENLVGSPPADVETAMKHEHASDATFEAWNNGSLRVTTPHIEWRYVVESKAGDSFAEQAALAHEGGRPRWPSRVDDGKGDGRKGRTLEDFLRLPEIEAAQLHRMEVAGIRLYTGPMFAQYNKVLRGRIRGEYVTTIHAINSGILKLSKRQPASVVYRGLSGLPPRAFYKADDHAVPGGVELAFMSTTKKREVALEYMAQGSPNSAKVLFEIRMGKTDKGADVSCLSQFPVESEILFPPLTILEVSEDLRTEGPEDDVLVIPLRLSLNLKDKTLEQVLGKMRASHLSFIDTMMDDLRLNIQGVKPEVLTQPLCKVREEAELQDIAYFNDADSYVKATTKALNAKADCYALLAKDEIWADVRDPKEAASFMRNAAEKCASRNHADVAAALLVMAVRKADPDEDHRAEAIGLFKGRQPPSEDALAALQAASVLLSTPSANSLWKATLLQLWASTLQQLGKSGGDRHAADRLAVNHEQSPELLWMPRNILGYEDIPWDAYKLQSYFHQINTSHPGVQLISQDPYIFICPNFLSDTECNKLISLFSVSGDQHPSNVINSDEYKEKRTSTSVVPNEATVSWLRKKIAELANVSIDQLQATKVSRYQEGQLFQTHTDAMFTCKWNALESLLRADTDEQLNKAKVDAETILSCPDRFCTCFVYLNDVKQGGCTFWGCDTPDDLFETALPILKEKLAVPTPSLGHTRQVGKSVRVRPQAGMAVIHFPCTTPEYKCVHDALAAHEGEPAIDPKFIVQQNIWSAPISSADISKALGYAPLLGYDSNGHPEGN